ncbi:NADPH quinone oxidoreductase [Chryseobacterium shigense]|uniref:NAD(P)H dehydrogenase (Quinone) n=1 Tax=Chryseobacterium shigense TaxID=297244 RepID=A0A1N7ILM6_9FLAO|nr:NAD(P)H-dependent oxidoreductase [Chryseobacterium shigense]PQA95794.1 NADPH quinone oxidoreductase [Chryseobacterium shigense]SIS37998.1 NAD(P)H dehydrogenase (quinone) [Chryseobacterium shigense]
MKILIILAHPEEKSLNAAMFNTAIKSLEEAGHEVKTTDLYRENYQPVSGKGNFTELQNPGYFKQQNEELFAVQHSTLMPDIVSEQEKIEWCDVMIWQFPLYWFSVPAILKGWVDKVFTLGKFYDNGKIFDNGFSAGKKAMLSLTTGGPQKNYVEEKYGDINSILFPLHHGILEFLGFSVLQPEIVYSVERLTDEERKTLLEHWATRLMNIEKEMKNT